MAHQKKGGMMRSAVVRAACLSKITATAAMAVIVVAAMAAGCARRANPAHDELQQITALEGEITHLQTKATLLEDVSDIKRLQRAYGYYLDAAEWDQMADLFADDGSIEIGLDGVYTGQKRVRQYLYALGGGREGLRPGELNTHMQLQPVIDVAPDGLTAKGRWRAFIMDGEYHKTALWGEGTYENEYVKVNGVWKIEKLHWYQTFMVPYAGGWAHNKDVNGGIYVSKKLPPDAPPTERYETWPGVYIPPYHYASPASGAATSAGTGTGTGADAHQPTTEAASGTSAAERSTAAAGGTSAASDPALAGLQATVDRLARRIARLQDRDQIENLISIYGYYLDKREWDSLADLFAEDGSMEISLRGIYVGRPSIRRALVLFGPLHISRGFLHNHMQLSPVIRISADGTHAWSRSRALSELATYGRVGVWGDGIYANEYVKVNGVWKIAKDHIYTAFFATYARGWEFAASGAPRESAQIPPDRPPSVLYQTYPGEYVPPFDYPHPVTGAAIEIPASLRVKPNPAAGGGAATAQAAPAGRPYRAAPAARASAPGGSSSPGASGGPGVSGGPGGQTPGDAQAQSGQIPQLAQARVARLEQPIAQLAQTVGRLEDENEIETLQRTYGYFTDKAMWREAADLFADDATLEIGGSGVYVGKAHIFAYLSSLAPHGLSYGMLRNHLQLQPVVTIAPDGRTAKARWRWLAELGDYRKSAAWGLGVYENEYVKVNGVWKIAKLHAYLRMRTPYDKGWAKVALPNTRASRQLPPDRPQTVAYRTYPATFIPPEDYPNPVTGR
jgi:SnoaL-like domain